MENENLIQLTFKLTKEQIGNDPISTETLWCEKVHDFFKVKNIPLFIDGISYDDVISVMPVEEGYSIDCIKKPSKNSTIWIFVHEPTAGGIIISALKSLGCGIESGAVKKYYALNVPESINIQDVYDLLDGGEEVGAIDIDYPSIRHL